MDTSVSEAITLAPAAPAPPAGDGGWPAEGTAPHARRIAAASRAGDWMAAERAGRGLGLVILRTAALALLLACAAGWARLAAHLGPWSTLRRRRSPL